MPIIVDSPTGRGLQRIVIGDLPEFNAADPSFVVSTFAGWYDAAVGVPILVGNGGGPGAVAVEEEPGEAFYTIAGSIDCRGSWPILEQLRRMLLAGLMGGERSVKVLDDRAEVAKQIFVRAYDTPTIEPFGAAILPFSFPLVAPDPFKYGLEPLVGDVGVFTGQEWFREYDVADFSARTYSGAGSSWSRTYRQAVPSGPYPVSLALTSDGDARSRRVVVTVTGPLDAGDWWLVNETTGERLWVDVAVQPTQELVLDMRAGTARLNGSSVDHLVYGDWLSFAPGGNTFRLVSGSASDAHAHFSALPAYL